MTAEEQKEFSQRLQRQLSQISGMSGASPAMLGYRGGYAENGQSPASNVNLRNPPKPEINLEAAFNAKHSKTFIDNMDFEFVIFHFHLCNFDRRSDFAFSVKILKFCGFGVPNQKFGQ